MRSLDGSTKQLRRSTRSSAEAQARDLISEGLLAASEARATQHRNLIGDGIERFAPHPPSDKQRAVLEYGGREALYGGAAGGGKSDYLLMEPLQYVHHPEFRCLILRRTLTQLEMDDSILDRAKSWWVGLPGIRYSKKDRRFTFPSGAKITFGHMQHESDKHNYQGAAWHLIEFDELTLFTRTMYTYLFSRQRRLLGQTIPLKMRAGSNPGGIGHTFVKHRFVDDIVRVEGEKRITREGRVFVPALLDDNPGLDTESYLESLGELDAVERKQLLEGDWTIRHLGEFFDRDWFTVIQPEDLPERLKKKVRAWDLASTEKGKQPGQRRDPDYTRGTLVGFEAGDWYILDVQGGQLRPKQVDDLVYETAHEDTKRVDVLMEQEPGASGKRTIDYFAREVLPGFTFTGMTVGSQGALPERAKPVSSSAENGHVYVLDASWNEEFFEEVEAFPQPGVHDDIVSTLALAWQHIAPSKRRTGKAKASRSQSYWRKF